MFIFSNLSNVFENSTLGHGAPDPLCTHARLDRALVYALWLNYGLVARDGCYSCIFTSSTRSVLSKLQAVSLICIASMLQLPAAILVGSK